MGTGQRYGAPAAKRGMDERRLGGLAPGNCLLTASEQCEVVSHRRRFLPLPWPLFGAAFVFLASSGVSAGVKAWRKAVLPGAWSGYCYAGTNGHQRWRHHMKRGKRDHNRRNIFWYIALTADKMARRLWLALQG